MPERPIDFYRDPDKVRKLECFHQLPGREYIRVTVEYVNSEVRVHVVDSSVLAALLEKVTP